MGWQDLHPLVRKAWQSQGGSKKTAKGFATNLELARIAGSKGGNKKRDNRKNRDKVKSKESIDVYKLEEILASVSNDEQV